jgi:hypothetical protein
MSRASSVDQSAIATLLSAFAKAIAPEVAREVAKHLAAEGRGDCLVDRKTAPISKRAWDRYAGKLDGFAAYRDGRRVVAKRADVLAWLERARAIAPHALDEDEAALVAAGVRLVRKTGTR